MRTVSSFKGRFVSTARTRRRHGPCLSTRDEEGPRIIPDGTHGYVTFNLLLSWQATPDVELFLRLENLGDKNYREHGSDIDAPGRSIGFWVNALF